MLAFAPCIAMLLGTSLSATRARAQTPEPTPTATTLPAFDAAPVGPATAAAEGGGPAKPQAQGYGPGADELAPGRRDYGVQIGAYTSIRKAAIVKSIVENLAPARVDRILGDGGGDSRETLYRVVVGRFKTMHEAERFARESRLKRLFPKLWMNPVSLEAEPPIKPGHKVSDEELGVDPYHVEMALHCQDNKRHGTYRALLQPEPETKGSEVQLEVNWNCIPDPKENWRAAEAERNPTYFQLAPVASLGSLSTTNTVTGDLLKSTFSYGILVSAFKSLGGVGPTMEYRLLNRRYEGLAGGLNAIQFAFEHRAQVGMRLPFGHRFEIEPHFGFYTQLFHDGTSPATAAISQAWVPHAGGKARLHLIHIRDRAGVSLTAGYSFLFPTNWSGFNVNTGMEIMAQLRARNFFPSWWGTDWFMEYRYLNQGAGNTTSQIESQFVMGVSLLISPYGW